MKLTVPLVRQDKDSVDCGLAAVHMITNFWKLPLDFKKIRKHLKVDKQGTYCPQLGSFLIKQGFKVKITTFNPGLFTLKDVGKNQAAIRQHLQKTLKTTRKRTDQKAIKFFLQFMGNGGEIEVKIPEEADIRQELKAKSPPIAILTSNFLFAAKPRYNFHFNVVTGIDDSHVYVNDPLWDERGGKHKYKIADFLFGIYTSSAGAFDNPSLIRIRKK